MDFVSHRTKNNTYALLVLLAIVVISQSIYFSHRFTIYDFKREKGWLYLGKYTFQSPKTQIYLTAIIGNNKIKSGSFLDLEVLAVPQQFWTEQIVHQCDVRRYDLEIYKIKSQKEISFKMMISNQSTSYQTTKSIETTQSKTYYFVLKDCLSTFEKQNPSQYSQFKLNLQVKSNERNYVSNEQHNNWTLPLFIVLTYLVLYFVNKDKNPPRNNWPLILLKISIWTGIMSLVFKYIDHLYYAYFSGSHNNFLDALNLICQSSSDSVLIFLIIMLAFGWTIKYDNHQDFTTWMPVCLISYFMMIVIIVMNKSRDTYYTKYHVFDTFAGYIMIVVRVGFYGLFLYALRKWYMSLSHIDGKLKNFLKQLTIYGSAFLGYIPLSFFLVSFFEKQSQYQVMNLLLQTFQLLLTIWLSIIISWSASSYRQVVGTMVVVSKNEKYF